MQLSRVERLLLANQYRMLEVLVPDEADAYARFREALEWGYEGEYEDIAKNVYADGLSLDACAEVINILDMFSALKRGYERLDDKPDVREIWVKFPGFSGNDETMQMAYARFFCAKGRFQDLDRGDDFNSHIPLLGAYRRMLREWLPMPSERRYNLTRDDIVRITAAARQPGA
jgi:uncharacterized protein YfbU (UPF0304 family)